jgi:glucose/arabinose dehydrogenase
MHIKNTIIVLFIVFTNILNAEENALPVNWQELPESYHTKSAVNPPSVISRPDNVEFNLPEGFIIEEYLSGFEQPRFMALGPKNEILLSDMAAGLVYVIKDKKAKVLIKHLDRPYGLALYKKWLYVAQASAVKRFVYDADSLSVGEGEEIISLHQHADGHSTRTIVFGPVDEKLYLSVGSASNVDLGEAPIRAAISRYNPDGREHEIFASGIRNGVGMRWYPGTQDLWVTSHERDGLGDDLVPDYFTKVKQGGFYGWPYAYIGPHEDPRHAGVAPEKVKQSLYPSVILGGHVGPLDIIFYTGKQFPEKYQGGAFIAFHGSWNRSKRNGYKIAFVPFKKGKPTAGPEDFLTGWMLGEDRREVWGRPVGLLQLPDGSLLITDDGAGKIWRVSYKK